MRLTAALVCAVFLLPASVSVEAAARKVPFSALKGWPGPGVGLALAAFQRSCQAMLKGKTRWPRKSRYGGSRKDWQPVCRRGLKVSPGNHAAVQRFWQSAFQPVEIRGGSSLFTGYFEPEYDGSGQRGGPYQTPIYGYPDDIYIADLGAFAPAIMAPISSDTTVLFDKLSGTSPAMIRWAKPSACARMLSRS